MGHSPILRSATLAPAARWWSWRSRREAPRGVVFALLSFVSAALNASACSSEKVGCAKDTDCKGDRVCTQGQCVPLPTSGGTRSAGSGDPLGPLTVAINEPDIADRLTTKAKTSEAREMVKRIYDGARAYYMDPPQPGVPVIPPQFPAPSTPLTPPIGTCCEQGGKCNPNAAYWEAPQWKAVFVSVDDPHYYSYQYEVADDGRSFTSRAVGDLDCDGDFSTFEMTGVVARDADGPPGAAPVTRIRELE